LERSLAASQLEAGVVVATAGTTNLGVIDDLRGVAEVCGERGCWLHVDGAYGGAALAVPSARDRFAGIERADSFTVDPHKWLLAPLDCAALVYREPGHAKAAFTQHAEYIDGVEDPSDWNPSDYAIHLSRRARGIPLWFSLAANGTRAYADAIEHGLILAREAAARIDAAPHLARLFDPELSVVVFRRHGWERPDYERWSDAMLARGLTLTTPTRLQGETLLRFCFVNPATSIEDVDRVIDSLA
jgi:glutamate/tyrosine decarboxylase-like PLP-dependent enzyme